MLSVTLGASNLTNTKDEINPNDIKIKDAGAMDYETGTIKDETAKQIASILLTKEKEAEKQDEKEDLDIGL